MSAEPALQRRKRIPASSPCTSMCIRHATDGITSSVADMPLPKKLIESPSRGDSLVGF